MYVVALCLIFTQIVIIPTALSHSQLCSLSLFDPIQELTIHGKMHYIHQKNVINRRQFEIFRGTKKIWETAQNKRNEKLITPNVLLCVQLSREVGWYGAGCSVT